MFFVCASSLLFFATVLCHLAWNLISLESLMMQKRRKKGGKYLMKIKDRHTTYMNTQKWRLNSRRWMLATNSRLLASKWCHIKQERAFIIWIILVGNCWLRHSIEGVKCGAFIAESYIFLFYPFQIHANACVIRFSHDFNLRFLKNTSSSIKSHSIIEFSALTPLIKAFTQHELISNITGNPQFNYYIHFQLPIFCELMKMI